MDSSMAVMKDSSANKLKDTARAHVQKLRAMADSVLAASVDTGVKASPVQAAASVPAGKQKDPVVITDTANANDSTNRYFQAYHNVRIFSDSLQAVSDSLFLLR